MNEKDKLRMIDGIENELIDRASPDKIKPKQKRRFSARMGMIAACLVIAVVAVNLAIFLPGSTQDPPIISGDPNKPSTVPSTYEEIKALIDASYGNNYDQLMGGATADSNASLNGSPDGGATPPADAPSSGAPEVDKGDAYVEVTDNQVDGVIEADIFKRTKTHIFYLRGRNLCAYSIAGEESELVGQIQFTNELVSSRNMYLSSDGKTATVICSAIRAYKDETLIITVDVSSPENMEVSKEAYFKGAYIDSRYTNGELLLFTRFHIKNTNSTENYIPSYNLGGGYAYLPPESILVPQKIELHSYLTVSKLTGKNLSYGGSVALLSFDKTAYVSENNIYATRYYYYSETNNNVYSYGYKTEIARIDYQGDLLKTMGTVLINGTVKDQYCMDEHDGVLRVFTTVNEGWYTVNSSTGGSSVTSSDVGSGGTLTSDVGSGSSTSATESTAKHTRSASLYCIDIQKMQVVASVLEFAPHGETVQSARFDGNTAYVCTAIVFSDPVFVFDLSDLENITYKDTGVIEGYSHSLIELEGEYLLGIGQTGWDTVKLELYLETDDGLISVSKVELNNAYSTSEYKAHYISREEMLFGFGYQQYGENYKTVYAIFKIVDGEIITAAEIDIDEKSAIAFCRGVYVDGYFYLLTNADIDNFHVIKID